MTDRTLTAAMVTEFGKNTIHPVLFLKLHFDSVDGGTLFFWNGVGTLVWSGDSYIGTGQLGTITPIIETGTTRASGAKVTLSGIPTGNIFIALDTAYPERLAELYFGFVDDDLNIIADPFILFSGRMDVMQIQESGETAIISLTIEHRLIDLERPKERTYTDEDQKEVFPGDKGLEFVVPLNDGRELVWGS